VKPKGDREPAATPVLRMMIPGEPGAVKAARRVRRGARRNLPIVGGTAVKHPDDKQGAPRLPNLTVADLKARIARLGRLERGFAREVALQRGAEDEPLFRERKQYVRREAR